VAARSARGPSIPSSPAPPQLSLFVVEPHPVVLKLKEVDVNQMTPLEAMKLLDELARLSREG
jgi:hypothetical protein